MNATDDVIAVEDTVDEMSVNEKTEILSTNYTHKTFDEIQTAVDSASEGDTVILDGYYQFKSAVNVGKQLNFVGKNDATLDGNNNASLFILNANGIIFKNITFKNGHYSSDLWGGVVNSNGVYDGGTFVNCSFVNNYGFQGGALHRGSAVNCSFVNNSADYGGAIYEGSAVNCTFENNSAADGGAIYEANAFDCRFINNSATNGGAMSKEGYNATNCAFINNSATNGGATFNVLAINSTFINNRATANGGAMHDNIAINCSFYQNHASNDGGAGYNVIAVNSLFEYNSAGNNGGALNGKRSLNSNFNHNKANNKGGAIYNSNISSSSHFNNNSANNGLYVDNSNFFEPVKSFSDLNKLINNNNLSDIYINEDYTFDLSCDLNFAEGIIINRSVTIHGNGFTLDGLDFARIFSVIGGNVTFINLNFIQGKTMDKGAAINGESLAIGCKFVGNSIDYGGAIYRGSAVNCTFVNNSASAIFEGSAVNCVFANNSRSALYWSKAENCTFINNSATYGGAMYYSSAVNCTFINNSASEGGAMLSGSAFVGNSAGSGGAIYEGSAENCSFVGNSAGSGGAIYEGSAVNCSFVGNSASYGGGAMQYGSAVNSSFNSNSASDGGAMQYGSAVDCSFVGNSAGSGGAIYEGIEVFNCTFVNNSAGSGGAINQIRAVENSIFVNNSANSLGGAIYGVYTIGYGYVPDYYNSIIKNCTFVSNSADSGGAMYSGSAENCTFVNNSAGYGGAIYTNNKQGKVDFINKVDITNCEFINCFADTDGGAIYLNHTANVTNSTFSNCTSGGNDNCLALSSYISEYDVIDCIFDTFPKNIEYHYVTNLNADNLTFFNGEDGVLITNLSDVRGSLVNKRITLTINNKKYNVTTDSEGIARFNIPDYLDKTGIYNATLNYEGDEINNPVSVNLTVTINKHVSNLNVDDLIIYKNEYGLLVANLSNIRGPLAGKKIIFTLNGQDYPKTTDAEGIVDFNPQNFLSTMGKFVVGVRFEGDDFNTPVSKNASVLIVNYKGTLYIELDGKYYNDTVISCKLINYKNNKPIYNAPIKLAFSNGEITYLSTDVNGVVTYNIPFNPGYYTVTASVNQSYVDVNNATLEDIEINKIFGVIEHCTLNNNKTLKFKLYNPSNLDIFRNVRLNLTFSNGENVEIVTDGEGIATYDIPFPKGTYSVSVIVVGDFKEFEDDYLENIVIENDLNCSINFTNDIVFDFSSYGSTNFTVDGGIVEQDNIYVLNHPEGIVSLKGNAITVFGLPTGNHTLVVTTTPDEYHNAVTAYLNITVNNINSKVIFSADIVFDYGMSGSIYVSVEGGSILKENIAVLNHPEANIDFTNDVITISGLDVGKYNLTVLTTPDNDHNAINSSVAFTIKEVDSGVIFDNDIVYTQGESGTTNITAIGCAENVGTISVDGHSEAIINMQNNVITVSGLNFGNYTLRIDTAPDKNHKSVSRTAKITVNKLFSKVTFAGDIVFDYGSIGYTNMAITGGVVLLSDVTVDNHSEAVISLGSNNLITVSNLTAGNYVLRVVTTPDESHRPVEATTNIVVNKIDSDISFNKNLLSFGYSGSDSITATVKGGSLLQPNIVVIGQPDAKIRLNNNVITVSDLDAGSYTLYVVSTPDENHNSVSASIDIIVNKIDSKLTLSNDVIFDYGLSGSTVIGAGSDSVSLDGISIVDYPNAKIGLNNNVITVSDLEAGSYTLHVSTTPNKNYNSITRSVKVIVNKIDSVIDLTNDISFDYGGYGTTEVSVIGGTISLSDISVINYPNAKITLKDNVITVSGLNAGNYTLKVISTGDNNHKSVEAVATVNVNKVDSDFTLNNDINFNYGKSGSTNVVVYGCSIVKSGISVDNHNEAIIDIKDNVITVSNLAAGTYTLRVVSTPDGNHKAVTKTAGIIVSKSDSNVGFTNDISFDYGGKGTTTLILDGCSVDVNDIRVVGFDALIDINDNNLVTVSGLDVGLYNLSVTSVPDSNHESVTRFIGVAIKKVDSSVEFNKKELSFVYGDSGSVGVNVVGGSLSKDNIHVLNHPEAKIQLNGNVVTVSGLNADSYTLSVTSVGDKNHNDFTNSIDVIVSKASSSINFTNDVVFDYGDSGSVGVNVAGGTISERNIRVLNHDEAEIHLKDGYISVSGLNVGNYTLSVTSSPDSNHMAVTKTNNITVNKVDSNITFDNDVISYVYGGSGSVGVNVVGGSISISGVSVVGQDAKPTFKNNKITVSGLNVGNYTLKVIITPDSNHNSVSTTIDVNVNKAKSKIDYAGNIVFGYGGTGTTTLILDGCSVKESDIYVVDHPEAVIKLSGKNVVSVSNLTVGKYTLHVPSSPDSNHIAEDTNVNITVNKIDSQVAFNKDTISFKYAKSGNVALTLDGCIVKLADISVVGHDAKITFKDNVIGVSNLAVGKYTLKVTTTPDSVHESVDENIDVVVTKNTAKITAKAKTFAYKSGVKWAITLKDDSNSPISGMKVAIKVFTGKKAKTYYAKTNSKGVANFAASKLSIGKHKVVLSVSHKGYTNKAVTSSVKIIKPTELKFKLQQKKYNSKGEVGISYLVSDKKTGKGINGVKFKCLIYTGKKYTTHYLTTKKIKGANTVYNGAVGFITNQYSVGKHTVKLIPVNIKYKGSLTTSFTIKKTKAASGGKYFRVT